jgi:hypothetical protein
MKLPFYQIFSSAEVECPSCHQTDEHELGCPYSNIPIRKAARLYGLA